MGDIAIGQRVMLRRNITRITVPEGREDNRSAEVDLVLDGGQVRTRRDLNGCRWWHVDDLQRCRAGLAS